MLLVGLVAAAIFIGRGAAAPGTISREEAWNRIVGVWVSPAGTEDGYLYPARQVYSADGRGQWY